jgi:hypothetical protein
LGGLRPNHLHGGAQYSGPVTATQFNIVRLLPEQHLVRRADDLDAPVRGALHRATERSDVIEILAGLGFVHEQAGVGCDAQRRERIL